MHYRICRTGCLNEDLSKGKIVLCRNGPAIYVNVVEAGGVGTILVSPEDKISQVYPALVSSVTPPDFEKVEAYVNSTK